MSNSHFSFKQFTINQDKCAMKVGTDGVLLGAWVQVENSRYILDVGTGTGLIAIQLAQRNANAKIVAVEVDSEAALQAKENMQRSPWANRMEVVCCDFKNYMSAYKFHLIVSNPPYFIDAMKCPDTQRNIARHADSLNYEMLFAQSARLLSAEGQVAIIVPTEAEKFVVDAAWSHKFFPQHRTNVYTKPGKPCRRILFSFGFQDTQCQTDELYIELKQGGYTAEYIALTKDFYLKM